MRNLSLLRAAPAAALLSALAAVPAAAQVDLIVDLGNNGALSLRSDTGSTVGITGYAVYSDTGLLSSGDETLGGQFTTLLDSGGEVSVITPFTSSGFAADFSVPAFGNGVGLNVFWNGSATAAAALGDLELQFGLSSGPVFAPFGDVIVLGSGGGGLLGDYNGNNRLDGADLFSLQNAVINSTGDLTFDINSDGSLTPADVDFWVTSPQVYNTFLGDHQLDGAVNLADFAALGSNFGNSGRTWGTGDFTSDGQVNLADFARLGLNFGRTGGGPGDAALAADGLGLPSQPGVAADVGAGDGAGLVLQIDTLTGEAVLLGDTALTGLEIASAGGGLVAEAFDGIDGAVAIAAATDSNLNQAAFPIGEAVQIDGSLSLGRIYDTDAGLTDVVFRYTDGRFALNQPAVQFVPEPGSAVVILAAAGVFGVARRRCNVR